MARGCAEPSLRDLFREHDELELQRQRLYRELTRRSNGPLAVRDRETLALRRYSREVLSPALDEVIDEVIFEAFQPRHGA